MSWDQNEHAVTAILAIAVRPRNPSAAECLPQYLVETPADGDLVRVRPSAITEPFHVREDDGSVDGGPGTHS
jgi:hypothetical protein